MIAGLLHDLGKVVLSYLYPQEYDSAVEKAKATGTHIRDIEREVFGVDHTRVNRWLSAEWHFPIRLSDPLVYHHMTDRAKGAADATAVVHVADILARGMGYGFTGDLTMPELSHESFQSLGISFERIDNILEDVEMEYGAGVDIFEMGE